ncbi:MAG: cytochrome c peroxidase [Saprospiraceae bacterium]|nr:cytochrome c peroxidase [Saprospiraceae bacterium]
MSPEGEVHKLIFTQYGHDFSDFQNEIQTLTSTITAKNKKDWEFKVKEQLSRTRIAYKKIEFIFDYLEPNYAYLYINGGPLPKLHKEVSEVDIIPPNGLQRLDELIFSEELSTSYQEVSDKTKELLQAIRFIKDSHLSDTLSQQNVFESLRSGVVRIFTLGLTGFDTPGSGNGILESLVSMRAMHNAFSMYRSTLTNKQKDRFEEILEVFNQGIQYLEQNRDFDTFDRMTFLKRVVNPLYKNLYSFQKLLHVDERSLNRHAQDYNSTQLFAENFLDLGYYSQFAFNDIKNEASIELGKVLFYDPILSHNLDMSCSTCHNPNLGFSDGLIKSATNLHNVTTKRNSPTLLDVGYSSKYFWDMREHDLEKQVAHVVEDSLEFNIGFKEIEKRLKQSSEYVKLFDEAYGRISSNTINRRSISNAIAAYVNTLNSFDSPFDKYVRGEASDLNTSAIAGFNLFMGKAACGTCHFAPVFNGSVPPFYTDAESEVLGVPQKYTSLRPILDKDQGRSGNGRRGDAHPHYDNSFKTVTVRNAELTAPYMHNGGFETLEEVLDFYNIGGGLGMGLDVDHQTLAGDSLLLNEVEVGQLISFLHALTDTTGLQPGKIDLPKFEGQPYWNKRGEPIIID